MYIIPSVDILNGKCVKLIQGKPKTGLEVSSNPVEVAKMWEKKGAKILHVVDLDAAVYGDLKSRKIVKKILDEVSIPVEVGGGVRTVEDAVLLVEAGARWVILGTAALENPEFVVKVSKKIGSDKIIVALDSKENVVLKKGWMEETSYSPFKIVKIFESLNIASYLFTDVSVEGKMEGVNISYVTKLAKSTKIPITYSGGISSIQDVLNLSKIGLRGVVVGRALYEGIFSLEEVLEALNYASRKN